MGARMENGARARADTPACGASGSGAHPRGYGWPYPRETGKPHGRRRGAVCRRAPAAAILLGMIETLHTGSTTGICLACGLPLEPGLRHAGSLRCHDCRSAHAPLRPEPVDRDPIAALARAAATPAVARVALALAA